MDPLRSETPPEDAPGGEPVLTRGQKVALAAGTAAVLLFGVLVVLGRHQGTPAVVAWAQGTLSPATPFWGLSVRWWVRAGKAMQFLAGCSVVLDLLPPEKVRRLGERLRSAYRRPVRARYDSHLDALREAADPHSVRFLAVVMLRSLVREKVGSSPLEAPDPVLVAGTFIDDTVPPKARGGPLSQADLNAWHVATRSRLRVAHPCATRCGLDVPVCPAQDEFIRTALRDKLSELPGRPSADLTGLTDTAQRVHFLNVVALAVLLGIAFLAVGVPLAVWGPPELPFLLLLGAITAVVLSANGAIDPQTLHHRFVRSALRSLLWVAFAPISGALERLARVLTAAEPGRVLRFAAFALFVVGFLLDLLGS